MKYLALVLILAGCATLTPQQYAERLIAEYGPACEAIGLKPQSEAWANCLMQHRQMAIAGQQARAAGFRAIQSMQPRPAYRAPITCSSFGNSTTCQ